LGSLKRRPNRSATAPSKSTRIEKPSWLSRGDLRLFAAFCIDSATGMAAGFDLATRSFQSLSGAAWIRCVPMRRCAKPAEIAGIVQFLFDEQLSSYLIGEVIAVDGGFRGAGMMMAET
jgi:NAD(P)-dependent dehydrogenase (short-subunit alcohol dehydrogenase family)